MLVTVVIVVKFKKNSPPDKYVMCVYKHTYKWLDPESSPMRGVREKSELIVFVFPISNAVSISELTNERAMGLSVSTERRRFPSPTKHRDGASFSIG